MDPATAFGIAAGAISVVDVTTKLVKSAHELASTGSLAHCEELRNLAKTLADETSRLRGSTGGTDAADTEDDLAAIADECSSTADSLISELEKLRLDGPGCHRSLQSIPKACKAMLKKKSIKGIEARLDQHRGYLDTVVLVKLRLQSSTMSQSLSELRQEVQSIVLSLNQGFTNMKSILQNRDQALKEYLYQESARQKIMDSLFFPEINSRHENIPEQHKSTCAWIFSLSPDNIDRGIKQSSERENSNPTFLDWLEHGTGLFWIEGKPGSGKSTLMKYLVQEPRTQKSLRTWASSGQCLLVSFFFWNAGSSLQKSVLGLLRSMLFQIFNQRRDLADAVISSCGPYLPNLPSWTVSSLRQVLRQLLGQLPTDLKICIFLDGLDEFEGDEDELLSVIDTLKDAQQVKGCVSSRPNQPFRSRIARSLSIKVQDLNHRDIEKTLRDKLKPKIEEACFADHDAVRRLMSLIEDRAQGVFLWVKLIIADLTRACYNDDSLDELFVRVEAMPDKIHDVYAKMLSKQDKIYQKDANRYFSLFLQHEDPTLLELACTEEEAWQHTQKNETEFFVADTFEGFCKRVKKRVIARCAGLVEFKDSHLSGKFQTMREDANRNKANPLPPATQLLFQEATLIHRTVKEFLLGDGGLDSTDSRLERCQILTRSYLGRLCATSRGCYSQYLRRARALHLWIYSTTLAVEEIKALAEPRHINSEADPLYKIADVLYRTRNLICEKQDVCSNPWPDFYVFNVGAPIDRPPFQELSGFAAFHGIHSVLAYRLQSEYLSTIDRTSLFRCTLWRMEIDRHRGRAFFSQSISSQSSVVACDLILCNGPIELNDEVIGELEVASDGKGFFKPVPDKVPSNRYSTWALCLRQFLMFLGNLHSPGSAGSKGFDKLWCNIIERLLEYGPDLNVSFHYGEYSDDFPLDDRLWIIVEETPLAALKKSRYNSSINRLAELLESEGAQERRRLRHVVLQIGLRGPDQQEILLSLTESQSEKILAGCKSEQWTTIKNMPLLFDLAMGLLKEHISAEDPERWAELVDRLGLKPREDQDTDHDSIPSI